MRLSKKVKDEIQRQVVTDKFPADTLKALKKEFGDCVRSQLVQPKIPASLIPYTRECTSIKVEVKYETEYWSREDRFEVDPFYCSTALSGAHPDHHNPLWHIKFAELTEGELVLHNKIATFLDKKVILIEALRDALACITTRKSFIETLPALVDYLPEIASGTQLIPVATIQALNKALGS